jgi:hypothetical protein
MSYLCPRRSEHPAIFRLLSEDTLGATCSFCGSLNPDEFMKQAEAGVKLGPTDKNYKVYVNEHTKFYFQHLTDEQMQKFVELMNAKKLNIGYPGHFYVLPYFMKPVTG